MMNDTAVNISMVGGIEIVIQVITAKQLVTKDLSLSTSHPYVIVRYNQTTLGRTKTVQNNCISPNWFFETFRINLNGEKAQQLLQEYNGTGKSPLLDFYIMHEHHTSLPPDPMGLVQIEIPLGPCF
jgi:hypothetical protein